MSRPLLDSREGGGGGWKHGGGGERRGGGGKDPSSKLIYPSRFGDITTDFSSQILNN